MTKLQQFADFSGQTIYVGIDVHLKNWDVSVFFNREYIRSFHQEADSDRLAKTLKGDYPNATIECAYEAGFSGFWIQRDLTATGIKCIVVNPGDIPQTDKDKKTKTDRRDSKRIAQSLEASQLQAIYIPEKLSEGDRRLVRYRQQVLNDLTRNKNRIKHFLYQKGVKVPSQFKKNNWSKMFFQWLKELNFEFENEKYSLEMMISNVEILRSQLISLNKKINTMIKNERYEKTAERILSVPGIGPLTTATLLAEISDISRFKAFANFNSYIGFYPGEHTTGESERKGHIIGRHHASLRALFIEAAWRAVKIDPALTLVFSELKKRMTAKRAIIRIARKLLSRVYHVWTKEEHYEKGIMI